jgi:hypothetical protein
MFDRTACPEAEVLAARPFVSTTALAALSALLDLALKDRTPGLRSVAISCAKRSSPSPGRGIFPVGECPNGGTPSDRR